MTGENNKVSKSPLITSFIFTILNVIAAACYVYFAIEALPIAMNPERGLEGIGLALLLIFMVGITILIIIFGLVSTFKAAKYNDSLERKSNTATICWYMFRFRNIIIKWNIYTQFRRITQLNKLNSVISITIRF